MPDFWADSQHRPNYMEFVGIPESERARMMGWMNRTLGTQSAQEWNKMSDILAYNRAPLSTQLAAKRGQGYGAMMAAEKGAYDIDTYVSEANRQAYQWLLQMAQQQEQFKQQQQTQMWGNIFGTLGAIGQGVGYAAGAPGGLFG
jgi:sulfur transfer protein SufE